jgi:hypothetical protein
MKLPPDDRRCTHSSSEGQRCRNYRASDSDCCFFHIKRPFPAVIRREPSPDPDRLDTAAGIHNFLARTLQGLAAGEIAPGRATALTYVAQTMLGSLARVREEQVAVRPEKRAEGITESVLIRATLDNLLDLRQSSSTSDEHAVEIVVPGKDSAP